MGRNWQKRKYHCTWQTSGIPGGYRLVSTYDLPGCKTILKFEIQSFSDLGGGILKLSDLDSLTIFIGGYSETLRFGLSDNFHWGGGGILKLSDLDSLTIFIGGVFWNSRIWTLWQFSFGGGILKLRIGVFWGIWTKISTTPAGSCITDSLSHTTYVETNKVALCTTTLGTYCVYVRVTWTLAQLS